MSTAWFDPTSFEGYLDARDRRFSGSGVSRDVPAFLAELAKRATDLEWLSGYAEARGVPGTTPSDYAPRLVRLGPECTVVAAIHFRGLDPDFPFVELSAQTAPLPSDLSPALAPFRQFRPRAMRIWHSAGDAVPDHATGDQMVLVGHIPTLLASEAFPHEPRIRFQAQSASECYAEYRRTYQAVYADDPRSAQWAQPEDQASLERCARVNALFRVLVDGKSAGFVAARPDSFRAWQGWCMVEEVLHPGFRGQGLAPAMQRGFLRALGVQGGSTVFGTINASNSPSLRTALRVGREVGEIGSFVLIEDELR